MNTAHSFVMVRTVCLIAVLQLMLGCDDPRDPVTSDPPINDTLTIDLVIDHAMIVDGSGAAAYPGSLAVRDGRILTVGQVSDDQRNAAAEVVDAQGLTLSPGFINVLSWATESLLVDPLSQSDIRQGITLEVFGEGSSMGPLNAEMVDRMIAEQGDLQFEVNWRTLGEYLDHLVEKGVSPNVASFVGATTVREHVLGLDDVQPTADQLLRMQALVDEAMREGALGVGSSLIYAPAFYAETPELVALARSSAHRGGMYISHLRSEGNRFEDAVEELIQIADQANTRAEIYHLKAAGADNWHKLPTVIERIHQAREQGLAITANMYTYEAGATGLDAAMPPWVQAGGHEAWAARLQDPEIRQRVLNEMVTPSDAWESLYLAAGSPDRIILSGFRNAALKHYTGMTLAEVADDRQVSAPEAAMDLVIEDGSRVGAVYFIMSEANIELKIRQPWVSFGSDAASLAPEGPFLKSNPHPRGYGNVARLLGRYVRDRQLISLPEAVRRLTTLPATTLALTDRGALKPGYAADLVLFDPATIIDHATFDEPHQYSTGVRDVWVNGVRVLKDAEHTGATPGAVVRGPGWDGWSARD